MGSNPYSKPADASIGAKKAIDGDRILLGISGGAASAAAAIILHEQGYAVELVHFDFSEKFRSARTEFACITDRLKDAEKIAKATGLPLKIVNADGYFQQKVISPLQENAVQGLGFESCSSCHSRFKLEFLFHEAQERNIGLIATGHFVRISKEPDLGISLWRSKDPVQDQSFLLARTRGMILKSLVTPLGHLKLADVERLLERKELSLPLNRAPEHFCVSQKNIAFKYLVERSSWAVDRERKGYVVSADQRAISEIKSGGELQYHWGQFDGLEKIREEATTKGFKGAAKYVVTAVDPIKHYVYFGPPKHLKRRELVLENVHWIVAPDLRRVREFSVVSRGQRFDKVSVEALIDNGLHLRLLSEEDSFEIGPGDLIALYNKELCMGSGEVYSGF
jgi:tRNA-specific 2-thiouridylase